MAKAAILDVLESTIGRYVENLDAQSLNVAVWAGKIELNSLKLDVDNVNRELSRKAAEAPNLAAPFRVVEGKFQSLSVDVPWARITSRPVVLRAAGLDVMIEPYDHLTGAATIQKDDFFRESQSSGKKKKKKEKKDDRGQSLDYAEETRQRGITMRTLADIDEDEEDKTSNNRESSSSGFKAKLVRRIIENLQLQIDGVHLRMRGQGCNAGIMLDHFSVTTTDEDGDQTFIDRATNSSKNVLKSFLYKSLKLKGLGIYCDEDVSSSAVTRVSRMSKKIPSTREKGAELSSHQDKSFILAPLSFEANLRQSDCIRCVDFPKYALSTELNSVSIVLLRTQLEMINNIVRDLLSKRQESHPLFPEYRPTEPIERGNAKLWWKYAVRCIGRLNRQRSWTEFFIAFKKRKVYINLYKRLVHHHSCSWTTSLTIAENVNIKTLEADRTISVSGIMNWRNMADAQVEFEKKKYEATAAARRSVRPKSSTPRKKSYFSSLFGSKNGKEVSDERTYVGDNDDGNDNDNANQDDIDEPPITLTHEEMKELETVALDASTEEEALSNDSILCDVKFTLGSFKVDLISFGSQPVASLEMGTVLTSFLANADGSYSSDFSLSSLNIHDKITPKSIFPLVVRSLQASTKSQQSKFIHAFEFKLKKASNGDQELVTKMVSFEIVASSILLKEMKKFAAGIDIVSPSYDTAEHSVFNGSSSKQVPGKLASAFADAWGKKVEKETSWMVDIEIHAPILVVPKCCVDPNATTLVIDLGNFCLTFGREVPCTDVEKWFDEQSKGGAIVTNIDNCTLKMENLSFVIAKASDKDWINSKFAAGTSLISSETIIGPITLSLNLGIENGTSGKNVARKCMFGILPAINLNLSLSQIARTLSVVTVWKEVIDSMASDPGLLISDSNDMQITNEEKDSIDELIPVLTPISEKHPIEEEERRDEKYDIIDRFHFSISLQKLSMKISNEDEESVEAHLVSATASCTQRSDGSSSIRVLMGWFWILDRLNHELRAKGFPRRQRLVAHSSLPRTASSFAKHDKYDIMEELEKRGIFESHHPPSGSLADVTITKSSKLNTCCNTAETSVISSHSDFTEFTNVDAKFRTLFIQWNPYAIRNLLDFKDELAGFIAKVVSLPIQRPSVTSRTIEKPGTRCSEETKSLMIVNAEMEAFEVCLNSANDDLPLFEMTMADSKVKLHLSNTGADSSLLAYVCVGDFRLEIPSNDLVLKDYNTLLGLSPNQSSSLLSIEYGKGPIAMQSCDLEGVVKETTDSFMKVGLSPMRFVHVQAQVLTLVEYVTEGVLGAMTASVASSAAQAARELNKAAEGEKIFHVIASGFDFVLPQAAYSPNHFLLHSGNLSIRFTSFPTLGHGAATLRLKDVTMGCNLGENLIETPICMDIDVKLAPHDAPTEDEKAMRVDISISRTAFLLTRQQYCQLRNTLEHNISHLNTYLREDYNEPVTSNRSTSTRRTHGGAEEILIEKRIYLNFRFKDLCLELFNENINDPIISMAAVETSIALQLLPDEQKTRVQATLHDLVCDDRRLSSLVDPFGKINPFRQIIRQINKKENSSLNRDVFQLSYVDSKLDDSVTIDVTIGSPQVVIIPYVISDLLAFFKDENTFPIEIKTISDSTEVRVKVLEDEGTVETQIVSTELQKCKTSIINLKTSDCRLVIIDMDCAQPENFTPLSSSGILLECFVLKGEAEGIVKVVTDVTSGDILESNFELHGENIEVYTAQGQKLISPLQILDPLRFSAFLTTKIKGEIQVIDSSFVTLSDLEMTLSMKNIALLMAICSSMNEAFAQKTNADNSPGSSTIIRKLSVREAAVIENLVHDLEKTDVSESDVSSRKEMLSRSESTFDAHTSLSHTKQPKKREISLKMTLPHTAVTMINDMQGLDEALFKVMITSCVCGADFCIEERQGSNATFRVHFNTSVQSDFFDSQSNSWEPLLIEPWELHVNATRGRSSRSRVKSPRLATSVDIESHPCKISFSEQFIIGLGAAKSMWSVFSESSKKANLLVDELTESKASSMISPTHLSTMRRRAVRTARSHITSLPYGIENHCGLMVSFEVGKRREEVCIGSTQYFSFHIPQGNGVGGARAYGQDSKQRKSVKIYVGEHEIYIQNLDEEVNQTKCAHSLGSGLHIFSHVTKIRKVAIIHLSSFITLHNETSMDFNVSIKINHDVNHIGFCGKKSHPFAISATLKPALIFGIPLPSLQNAYRDDVKKSVAKKSGSLIISPMSLTDLRGEIELPSLYDVQQKTDSFKVFDLSCSSFHNQVSPCSKMVMQIARKITFVKGIHPLVEFFLRPRTILYNNMLINIEIRTCMSHTFSMSTREENVSSKRDTIHSVDPFGTVELYTPGSSVAISIKCADRPVGGTWTTWNSDGWIDVPLGNARPLQDDMKGVFPFVDKSGTQIGIGGSEFTVTEHVDSWDNLKGSSNEANGQCAQSSCSQGHAKRIEFSFANIGVDHTGDILFLKWNQLQQTARQSVARGTPRNQSCIKSRHSLSAFSSSFHKRRITLLPSSSAQICLLHLTIDGNSGTRRSLPFCIEDISLCEGGTDSTAIQWDGIEQSQFYAYRRLSSVNQSEVHIIPEFIVFNGGDKPVRIIQPQGNEFVLEAGKMTPIHRLDKRRGLIMILDFLLLDSCTAPIRVDTLGMKVCVVKSSGFTVGSVAVQTVRGKKDSRFVVKLGNMNGGTEAEGPASRKLFEDDFIRFRVRWTQLEVALQDTSAQNMKVMPLILAKKEISYPKVAHILFERFTIDFQRIYKDEEESTPRHTVKNTSRSQFAMLVHNIRITDCSGTKEKVVLESSAIKSNLIDLCIRTRGSTSSGLICVDLIDLKIAHDGQQSEKIRVKTNEAFLWSLLDLTSRSQQATAEISGDDLEIDWDEESREFIVNTVDTLWGEHIDFDEAAEYCPPSSDKLYAIRIARVTPIALGLTFKRAPMSERYRRVQNVRGAKLINYFTKKLKFTIKDAQLNFARYSVENVKGPPDRIMEVFKAHYFSQIKRKLLILISASSLDDWKLLADREGGSEQYVEGDIMRVGGTIAGRSAGFILDKTGKGIAEGLSFGTSHLGDGIQSATEVIGVGLVGSGVNNIVSSVGGGVGNTLKGVGKGGSEIIKGAGKGVGQIVGGVGGGLLLAAKGIGNGVRKGDGNAIASGLGDGVVSMGSGIVDGAETVVRGGAKGVFSVGKGLFSGLHTIGKGVENAVTGKQKSEKGKRDVRR